MTKETNFYDVLLTPYPYLFVAMIVLAVFLGRDRFSEILHHLIDKMSIWVNIDTRLPNEESDVLFPKTGNEKHRPPDKQARKSEKDGGGNT